MAFRLLATHSHASGCDDNAAPGRARPAAAGPAARVVVIALTNGRAPPHIAYAGNGLNVIVELFIVQNLYVDLPGGGS